MRLLVVGGGGREHALVWACERSSRRPEIICAPGNAGTASVAENVPVALDDARSIAELARSRGIDLVVLGPDASAAAGAADACAGAGIAVFGPTAAAARIESSKTFAKSLMDSVGIPTARWLAGGRDDRDALAGCIRELGGHCVVKADGPALGKGVVVCDTEEEAHAAVGACLDESRFGEAGERVLVEERLKGREVSVFAVCDGHRARLLPVACDYKRSLEGDAGPNTGGMGAYSPPHGLDGETLLAEVEARVIQPCLTRLAGRGTPFRGCLYAGLMLTDSGVQVLEFNARFGDPEAQVVLPLLDEDPLELFLAAAAGDLSPGRVASRPGAAVGVVAVARGYPASAETGDEITGLDRIDADVLCFHAGTRIGHAGRPVTAGGRVLTMVATADDVEAARTRAYANLRRVRFEGMRFRSDIASPVVELGR